MRNSLTIIFFFVAVTAANSQILSTSDGLYHSANGDLYSGKVERVNESGQKEAVLSVVNGKAEGVSTFYFPNGKIQETGSYTAGHKDGKWEQFAENGVKTGEAFYRNGNKDGVWTMWDDQGNKRYHMVYNMGQKIDVWKIWDANQNLVSERVYSTK